jgi:putative NADH-flavin reductase
MKITIIGASAGIGLLTVKQALERGHEVTALSRNTAPIPDHPLLTKINGSATSAADLKKAIGSAEAVIITIGATDKKSTNLFTDTAHALIKVAAEVKLTAPVLVITGFGIGESGRFVNLFMWLVVKWLLKKQSEDKARLEELLAQSNLKWEIVRTGMLTNGALTKAYTVVTKLYQGIKIRKISRADVADFLLNEAENPTMLYQHPALTY